MNPSTADKTVASPNLRALITTFHVYYMLCLKITSNKGLVNNINRKL